MKRKKSLLRRIYTENPGENFIKKRDSWTSIIFSDPFSIPIARLAAKSKKLHPNHFSILGLVPAFIAVYCFLRGELVYGAFFYLINFIIDGVDGKLARLTNQLSKSGEALDRRADRIKNAALYFSLWYSQFYLQGYWLLGGFIIFCHYALMVVVYLFIKDGTYKTIFPRVYSYYATIDEGFIVFFFAPLLNQVRLLLPILILLQSISFLALSLKQKEEPDFKFRLKKMIRF
jgi:phosphatidylglycerophosphate synthase